MFSRPFSVGFIQSTFRGVVAGLLGYITKGLRLNLASPITETSKESVDKSSYRNDAVLYTGRYITTDGLGSDFGMFTITTLPFGNYYVTGKVRPNGTTIGRVTIDSLTSAAVFGLTPQVWQTFTTATQNVTPSGVCVGWDGGSFSAADWSDIKLIDADTGTVVGHWPLTDTADGNANGRQANDVSGNGFHGVHYGCAAGNVEGITPFVAGRPFGLNEDKLWFDGSTYINLGSYAPAAVDYFGACTISVTFCTSEIGNAVVYCYAALNYSLELLSGNNSLTLNNTAVGLTILPNVEYTAVATFNASGQATNLEVTWDGGSHSWSGIANGGGAIGDLFLIGAQDFGGFVTNWWKGYIKDFSMVGGVLNANYDGTGKVTWTDTSGEGNDGTVTTTSGTLYNIGEVRETIIQTGAQDWTRRMYFDGVDDICTGTAIPTVGATYFEIEATVSYNYGGPISHIIALKGTSLLVSDYAFYISSNKLICRFGGFGQPVINTNYNVEYGDTSTWKVVYDSAQAVETDRLKLFRNGVLETDVVVTYPTLNRVLTDNEPGLEVGGQVGTAVWFKGLIYNLSINVGGNIASYANTGNTAADWLDSGVNGYHLTPAGNPTNYLIPPSDASPGLDAHGHPLLNKRLNNRQINLFGDGEKAVASDSSSFDTLTNMSFECWIDPYETVIPVLKTIVMKGQPSISGKDVTFGLYFQNPDAQTLYITAGDGVNYAYYSFPVTDEGVSHIVVTFDNGTWKAYQNTVEKTVTFMGGSAQVSNLATNNDDVEIGDISTYNSPLEKPVGDIKWYDYTLDPKEVFQNYETQREDYQL